MYDLEKCILVTNNDRAAEKWKDCVAQVCMTETYREVLEKTRDLIHARHKLLTHPQASSLKPNQTQYRTILLYQETGELKMHDLHLIESAIEAFEKWIAVRKPQSYDEKIEYDYKTIDISMIENVIPKL